MSVKVFPLDFVTGDGAILIPKDQQLHDMAVDYCAREVEGEVNLSKFSKVYVAAEVDEAGRPMQIEGVTGYVLRPDISLYRATSAAATTKLHHRWHTYFADNGIIGQDVFLYLNNKESDEQRCANWDQELLAAEAKPASRFLVTVRAK